MDNIVLATEYRGVASDFEISARILVENTEFKDDGTPSKITAFPIYFLISHAAELLLKAALLKRGVTEKEIKNINLRHNLGNLLEAVKEKELSVSPEMEYLIKGLNTMHRQHTLRYRVLVSGFTLRPSILFEMLGELLALTIISSQGR